MKEIVNEYFVNNWNYSDTNNSLLKEFRKLFKLKVMFLKIK